MADAYPKKLVDVTATFTSTPTTIFTATVLTVVKAAFIYSGGNYVKTLKIGNVNVVNEAVAAAAVKSMAPLSFILNPGDTITYASATSSADGIHIDGYEVK